MALALEQLEHRVGLWYVRTKEVTDARTLDAVRSLLTAEELKKHAAYRFEKNKHEYLITRAVERGVLAACLGKRPAELAFTRSYYGRPQLTPSGALHFNLTNTVEMIACAVSTRELGVDAEPLSRADDVIDVAETVFTANERAMLASLDLDARRRRAVELWTLKEAYMKARGLGMSLPVKQFEICFEGLSSSPSRQEGAVATKIRLHEGVDDDPSRWLLATRQINDHLVSLCVERRPGESELEIVIERADLAALLTA